MNKYYTPELEDLWGNSFYYHRNDPNVDYGKVDITPSHYAFLLGHWYQNDYSWPSWMDVKFKHLDSSDIEELGFRKVSEDSDCIMFNSKKTLGLSPSDDNWILIEMSIKDNYVFIERQYNRGESEVYFNGVIKNINELKRVLKQIGVDYEV